MLKLSEYDVIVPMAQTLEPKIQRELRLLAKFIEVYCHDHHDAADASPIPLRTLDIQQVIGHMPSLCPQCAKLLAHAFTKRMNCPMDPKPMCKHCPKHCYAPDYRQQIRTVMAYSGRKLVMRGRLDYLLHLLF